MRTPSSRSPNSHTAGNPDGDVTVVEFFDYNCGYCRRALPDLVKLMESDSQVRVVLKELPIFGEESEAAAKGALAANKQGKYFEMHQKLFNEPGKADKEKVLRVGKELNLDVEKLEKDMDDPIVKAELDEARELAQKLELQGTPFYLIGDRTIPGAPEDLHDQLVDKVKRGAREGLRRDLLTPWPASRRAAAFCGMAEKLIKGCSRQFRPKSPARPDIPPPPYHDQTDLRPERPQSEPAWVP